MLHIAICDDDQTTVELLQEKVWKTLQDCHEIADIELYTQSRMLYYDIGERKHFDIILCDIEMPQFDGMELASYIRKYLPNAIIIFITSYTKYAIKAYELAVFRYIPKNNLDNKLPLALKDAFHSVRLQTEQSYLIYNPNNMRKVYLREILYLKKDGKYTVFHLQDGSSISERKTLAAVHKALSDEAFFQLDRTVVVNLAHIRTIADRTIKLDDDITKLSVSYSRLRELKNALMRYLGAQL